MALARTDFLFDPLGSNGKSVLGIERRGHHSAAGELNLADVLRVVGIKQDHFVARVDDGKKSRERGVSQSVGHDDIAGRDRNAVDAAQFVRQCFAQRGNAGRIAVMDVPGRDGGNRRSLDVRRRVVRRLAEFHMNQPGLIGEGRLGVHAEALWRRRSDALGNAGHGLTFRP
jgi:hypothetical protein